MVFLACDDRVEPVHDLLVALHQGVDLSKVSAHLGELQLDRVELLPAGRVLGVRLHDAETALDRVEALLVVALSVDTSFPIIMTPELAFGLFALTLGMCAASATGAIMKVMKLDPAMVFNR